VLGACTPMQWTRPGATADEFARDSAECKQQAWAESWARTRMVRPLGPVFARDAAGRPILLSPFGFADPFDDRFMEETRLADFCLRAKGYRLEAVAPAK
jgi:hypothetical protein